MTVIYLDSLWILNLILDYLLLRLTARVTGAPVVRLRLLAGAALGACYAAAQFLPGGAFLSHPAVKVCAGAVMVLIAFGGEQRLLRQMLIFFALSCALAGGILAVGLLGGTGLRFANGVPATGMDVKVVVLAAAGCYAVMTLAGRGMGRHWKAAGEVVEVELELEGRRVRLSALRDTGHTLTDPAGGRTVVVAEADALEELLPPGVRWSREDLREPAAGLERLSALWGARRWRLLPYRAVGQSCGLLLALRVDRGTVDGKVRERPLVALSPGPLSDGGGYRALVGAT